MRFLLDTHVLLWMFDESSQIPPKIRDVIANTENKGFVSIASLYEIAIKKNIGKLYTQNSIKIFADEIGKVGLELIPITTKQLEEYVVLPINSSHKDPFDRLLIATAIAENLSLITADEKFRLYSSLVNIIW